MHKYLKLFLILTLALFVFSGCDEKKRAGILFNSEPITRYNLKHASRSFQAGKRIYYLFYSPKKIKSEFIRVQVGKTGDNVAKGGYNVVWSNEYRVMKQNVFYYYDHFTLNLPGRYVMQIFDINNLAKPLTWNYFYVNN